VSETVVGERISKVASWSPNQSSRPESEQVVQTTFVKCGTGEAVILNRDHPFGLQLSLTNRPLSGRLEQDGGIGYRTLWES